MTRTLRPFTGFVPTSQHGARVVSPPKALLRPPHDAGTVDPFDFRSAVGRGAGPTSAVAREWLDGLLRQEALRSVFDSVLVHRAERDGRSALGLLGDVSIEAYAQGAIKAHEATIASNAQKMVGYMLLTRIFGNPVVLAHRPNPAIVTALTRHSQRPPDVDFEDLGGTRHQLWIVAGEAARGLAALVTGDLYIADGHHRLEAARALAEAEGRPNAWFPAGLYGEDQFEVWAFARGIRQAPLTGDALIARLHDSFELVEVDNPIPRPPAAGTIGTRIAGRSFILTIPADRLTGDVRDRLDASALQKLIFEPLFGIDDPRRDKRLETIADGVDAAHNPDLYDAWFLLYPSPIGTVMDVADSQRTMPPKSTYFLPKLPGGLITRPLDE